MVFFPCSPLVENADSFLDFVRCRVCADNQIGSQRPVASPDASARYDWDFPRHLLCSTACGHTACTCRASADCHISWLWCAMAMAHARLKAFLGAVLPLFIARLAGSRQHRSTERLSRVLQRIGTHRA